ncbi:MAG: PEP/pyruvate-binding domain-containing protein [Chromatiaceae bacterium]
MIESHFSTGIAALDRVFRGLLPGDNLVWHIDAASDFAPLVPAYCRAARKAGRKLIYFRFADHEPWLAPDDTGEVHLLDSAQGFERVITEVRAVIREAGRGTFYLFDCLSALAETWSSDRMLGNFFMLTCPYVYDMESVAYFPLLRNLHSVQATGPISRTTQILTEVYRRKGTVYIQPSKVEHRYSPTMYMLHAWEGDHFTPISDSSTIAEILTAKPWAGLDAVHFRLGKWNRTFLQAERVWDLQQRGEDVAGEAEEVFRTLIRMVFSRDERVLSLAEQYLDVGDLVTIWKRIIGTGLIGGKSVGMLLARAILRKVEPRWGELLEAHDSFFIGSDIFYSYLVDNGCWLHRQRQILGQDALLDDLHEARRRIITGRFPDELMDEFVEMLDYFSQSPIIVRSSSLLEDSYGNAFAGKYESVFCANQGSHQKRLDDFMAAVKTIYASTMSEKALRYREQRGLLDRDEQMSLLVQRVSGRRYGNLFFPQAAGVGLSINPYVWNKLIDPKAGMVRLVFGLGTRAVDRSDDDYTRVVALNAPQRRPDSDVDEVRQYSQRRVDVIDLDASQVVAVEFSEMTGRIDDLPLHIFASPDEGLVRRAANQGLPPPTAQLLTFEHLLTETPFVADMRQMLSILEEAYQYPVDIEFTANFAGDDQYKINLVQCRPLQIVTDVAATSLPDCVGAEDIVLEACGAVIGMSRQHTIDRVIYVSPSVYGQLPTQDRYAVARLIGRLSHIDKARDSRKVLLAGPGRWGTTMPALGVPVSFAEIDTVSVLCEIVAMRESLVPDVSLGTHFFNDLVEMDILYLALFPGRAGNHWSLEFFEESPNRLAELVPDAAQWSHAVRVIDLPREEDPESALTIWASSIDQKVLCYMSCSGESEPPPGPRTDADGIGAGLSEIERTV